MEKIIINDTRTLNRHLKSTKLSAISDVSVFYKWTKGEYSIDLAIQKFMENNSIEFDEFEIDRIFFEKWLRGLGFKMR